MRVGVVGVGLKPLTPAEQFWPKVFYGPINFTFEISTFSISREIRKNNPAGCYTVKNIFYTVSNDYCIN
jgi:hypothetical protein